MKIRKILIPLLVLVLLACWIASGTVDDVIRGVVQQFLYHRQQEGNFSCECRNFPRDAFVIAYHHRTDGSPEITVPETCGSYRITALGNGAREPFCILLPDWYDRMMDADNVRSLTEGTIDIRYYDFQLHIGKTIRSVDTREAVYLHWPEGEGVGTPIVYVPRVYVHCDGDNPHFYSQDGKLYRSSGELVEGFIYYDRTV